MQGALWKPRENGRPHEGAFDNNEEKYEYKWFAFRHVDLHTVPRNMATGSHGSYRKPVLVRLGHKAVGLYFEEDILASKDGEKTRKDLLVITDGWSVSQSVES